MPTLLIEKGPDKGKHINIEEPIVVGRETTSNLRINDLMVSRFHFKIENRPEGYYIVDLNSMNGTFVNSKKTRESLLNIGDKIQIGETLFSFLGDSPLQKQGPIGQTIEGYKIIERIGRGGMGTVYKATQISLKRVVALKILSEELIKDKTFVDLFIQEAQAAAQLNHPNIVQVYDVAVKNNVYYFSMEFLSGGSVEDIIAKKKKFSPEDALDVIMQAAKGLEYAEKKGIVHRDIKPDNLMIGEDNVIKICDLGLARNLHVNLSEESRGNIFGTPHYVAPEQAMGKQVDHRADIYSLGSTFYRLLTGVTPYTGASIKEIISKKIKDDPMPLKQVVPELSKEFCIIVEKMMKRDPEERFQSTFEVTGLLEKIKSGSIPMRSAIVTLREKRLEKVAKSNFIVNAVFPVVLSLISLFSIGLIIWYFTFSVQPNFMNNFIVAEDESAFLFTDVNDYQVIKEIKNIESVFKSKKEADVPLIYKTIEDYKKLLNLYPKSSLAPKISRKINELEEKINSFNKEEEEKYKDLRAEMEFGKLIDLFKNEKSEIIGKNKIQDVPSFISKWGNIWTKFQTDYAGTSSAENAEEERKQVRLWGDRFENAGNKYDELEKTVNNDLELGNFAKVLKLLNDFVADERYAGFLYDKSAFALISKAKGKAESDSLVFFDGITSLVKSDSLENALKMLKEKKGYYGLPEIEVKINEKIEEIERTIQSRQEGEYQRLLGADQRIFLPTYIDTLVLVQKGRFDDAQKLITGIRVQTDYYKNRVKNTSYEISAEHDVIGFIILNSLRIVKAKKKIRNQRITKIGEEGVIDAQGKIIPWNETTTAEFCDLINNKGWILSNTENLKLAVVCMKRSGMLKEANDFLVKSKAGNQDKQELAIIDNYMALLKDEKSFREKDAESIFKQAESYYYARQNFNALKCFVLVQSRFSDTDFYKNNSKLIEEMIQKCK